MCASQERSWHTAVSKYGQPHSSYGGPTAPGIGRVVEPPGTAYLPANLPATPSEWSSNSDDSE